MYHCVAPNKSCGNHICCGLPPTPNSYWCQKHIKYFGGITSKYHELESKLKLDPFKYPSTIPQTQGCTGSTEYLKWTKDEVETEFKLLWKIYTLRSKIREYGFAEGFRDMGHDYRLQAINNSLCILNSKLSAAVDCEQYDIQEQDELKVVERPDKIRLNKKNRTTKIRKQQEIIGVWDHMDIIIYCKRQAVSYLLACLRKYFQRWPDGDLLFEHSINMASEMCRYCEHSKKMLFEHINDVVYNQRDRGVYRPCCIDCTITRMVLNPHNHVAPIVSVIESYNININKLFELITKPSWLIWGFNYGEDAEIAIQDFINKTINHYPNIELFADITQQVSKFVADSGRKQLPLIDIKSAIRCTRLKTPMRYNIELENDRIVYRRFIDNDAQLYRNNDIIKSLSQVEVDITDVSCGCRFAAVVHINVKELKQTIGKYVGEFTKDNFDFLTLTFLQFHYPESLYLYFHDSAEKDIEEFETSVKQYYSESEVNSN